MPLVFQVPARGLRHVCHLYSEPLIYGIRRSRYDATHQEPPTQTGNATHDAVTSGSPPLIRRFLPGLSGLTRLSPPSSSSMRCQGVFIAAAPHVMPESRPKTQRFSWRSLLQPRASVFQGPSWRRLWRFPKVHTRVVE